MAVAAAPWHALVVRLLDRTGKGIRSSPRDALIADSADATSVGRAFGFHRAMDHAGAVVGPLVATGLLSAHVPVRRIFLIAAIPGLLAVVALLLVREPARGRPSAKETADAGGVVRLPKDLGRYLAILLVFSLGNSSDAFLLLRARELGVSLSAIPALWALLHVSKMAWSYAGGVWSDRAPRVRLILAGWLVYALAYVGLALASQAWQVWVLFVIYGAFYGLSEPAEKALVRDLAPTEARGRVFGYYNFIVGGAALPAGLVMGAIWSWSGPRVSLAFGAAIALVAALMLALWDKRARTG
jgi:MFS family permease